MKLKFKNQAFQMDAVNAVVDLFAGQEKTRSTFSVMEEAQTNFLNELGQGNALYIDQETLTANMHTVQKRNNLPLTPTAEGCQFCIEMETGTGKTYVYRIWNSELPNVFERHYLYHIQEPLDVAAMRLAAEDLCGTHDFRAFCSLKKFKRSTVRRLEAITIQELGPELRLTFTGDGFLYHMVRILVGTLLAVGRGEKSPRDMADILASQDRRQAGETVPACGLCLEAVRYTR